MINLSHFKADFSSQGGENGILAKIFETIGTTNRTLIDVGAFDLKTLSNVYPLWNDEGWAALLIEGNSLYWQRMIRGGAPQRVKILNLLVEPEGERSLDMILRREGTPMAPDLLSIDVDGVDYHIWKGLLDYQPRVVVIEYNPTIPPHLSVIGRRGGNYIGASAKALADLGVSKGYSIVACTATNLVFVTASAAMHFQNAGDLNALFDPYAITYAMTSYDGGLFYSNTSFPYGYNPLSVEVKGSLENGDRFFVPSTRPGFYLVSRCRSLWRAFRRRKLKSAALSLHGFVAHRIGKNKQTLRYNLPERRS